MLFLMTNNMNSVMKIVCNKERISESKNTAVEYIYIYFPVPIYFNKSTFL